jgi:deoxyribonuclease V
VTGAWPRSAAELERVQRRLAAAKPAPWTHHQGAAIAGCFVCFPRGPAGPGARGDPAWAAAATASGTAVVGGAAGARGDPGWAAAATASDTAVVGGAAGAPYAPGLLALREGPLLEAAVRALRVPPDVVLVNATGRDHPRGAGLALHLGAVLDLPTVGVTHRPLLAEGAWPEEDEPGAGSPLTLDGRRVGFWLRTRRAARPLAVHPGWRTDEETARAVVLAAVRGTRTPEPLRAARRLARVARARA